MPAKKLPEIIVFAGPNGSGKSTITRLAKIIEPYINADDIKRTNHCTDLEAAQMAEAMREKCIKEHKSFTFETVLSTDRNLKLLKKAKTEGYFIRCIYVLTCDPNINVARVKSRESQGGHGVPEDKIISRYEKALVLIQNLSKFAMLCIFMIILMCLLEFLKNARPNSFSGKMNIGLKRIFMIW